ncbi:hypothetical protein [Streptomyces sp. t39]|nr:hypothetical protein [Streptomyces sp. t39]
MSSVAIASTNVPMLLTRSLIRLLPRRSGRAGPWFMGVILLGER